MTRPVARVEPQAAYRVPRHPAPVDLHLDGNEGAAPPASLLARLDTETIRRYPSARALEEAWAARLGVAPDQLLVTAGADEALERTLRAYLGPGRDLVLPVPTFEMLARYARLAGGTVVEVPWTGGAYPVEAVLSNVTARTGVIAVVTPNNPTGAIATPGDIARLAAAAPHAVILVDLAYVEFADADPTAEVLGPANVVVARTLSKAWGLAGLRVGCAVGPADLVGALRAAGSPYSVSGPSIALAGAWLEAGGAAVAAFVARIRAERAQLATRLRAAGADVQDGQANFVLARVRDASFVRDALAGLGIAVRSFPGRAGLTDAVRVSCPGDAAALERLSAALDAALRPEAILFDMDGVLADVSASFRACVERTAASYGVTLEPGEVSRAKAAGGANNDWILTHRLVTARGVEATLEEVTSRFEAIYNGDATTRGLNESERLLCSRAQLRRLASKVRLAVVTGRTREDALRTLRRNGLDDLFPVLVTMHETPSKPDPAPVRLALERLGVTRAWMIGDTVDDVRAARRAGVVPLAILAPGEDPSIAAPALRAAGAARLIDSLDDLEVQLP